MQSLCCLCYRIPCKNDTTGLQWKRLHSLIIYYTIFIGYLAFVLLPLCLLFLLLFRLLHSNNNDCNLQKAKRIWSALAHAHTQTHTQLRWVRERERTSAVPFTQCGIIHLNVPTSRGSLCPRANEPKCSSCGQLRAAAFPESAKYIENSPPCLAATHTLACSRHSKLHSAFVCLSASLAQNPRPTRLLRGACGTVATGLCGTVACGVRCGCCGF